LPLGSRRARVEPGEIRMNWRFGMLTIHAPLIITCGVGELDAYYNRGHPSCHFDLGVCVIRSHSADMIGRFRTLRHAFRSESHLPNRAEHLPRPSEVDA
jgi:hypothetical protein